MRLFLSRLHFPVTTLGPGRRLGVWFQGCTIRCAGCVSMDTWAQGRGETTVEAVLAAATPWLAEADGITVTGGEPFDQPEALTALLRGLRARTASDILVYSGYPLECLATRLGDLNGLVDALMCDPYEAGVPQTMALRGSDNQRLLPLTPRGRERFADGNRPVGEADKVLDLMLDENGTAWLVGIPRRRDLRRLMSVLNARGHRFAVSEARALDRDPA